MSKNILIPLDGSVLGETALSFTRGVIDKYDANEKVNITLFHVITVVRHQIHVRGGLAMSVPYTEDELDKMRDDALDYLKTIGESIESERVTVQCKVAVGENPAKEIIQIEEEVGADLVAMSTHGRSGVTRFVIGSVAEKVMRGGTVPVLMVRASEEE